MWNLKYDTNEHIYKTEINSQKWRTDLQLPRARVGEGWDGSLGINRSKLLQRGWVKTRPYYIAQGIIVNIL